ncbi:MAG TPA: hypothetical protein VK027_00775 [Chitinophagaceae bacterium]|nr:hypothetical protein [Chitinophagaceae bacterium]
MIKKLEKLFEIYGWIQIVFSAILLAGMVGVVLYFTVSKIIGMIVGIIIVIFGMHIAYRAYKGKGTIHLLSRTIASPELDNKEEENNVPEKEKVIS